MDDGDGFRHFYPEPGARVSENPARLSTDLSQVAFLFPRFCFRMRLALSQYRYLVTGMDKSYDRVPSFREEYLLL